MICALDLAMASSKFHKFEFVPETMDIPEKMNNPFGYIPCKLSMKAAEAVKKHIAGMPEAARTEIEEGKMFGVLVARDSMGEIGYLAGFSGLLQGKAEHEYFVPPIYDISKDGGYFRNEEKKITGINESISHILSSEKYRNAASALDKAKRKYAAEYSDFQAFIKSEKERRDNIREYVSDLNIIEGLTSESRFQKAEAKRMKKAWQERICSLEKEICAFDSEITRLKEKRKSMSASVQEELFRKYRVTNAEGETKDIFTIFKEFHAESDENGILPPGGTGDCAGVKLMQYAYMQGLAPLAFAEFWQGKSPSSQTRIRDTFYPACKSKCYPLLCFMTKGLPMEENIFRKKGGNGIKYEILYEDDYLIAVNKPGGILSVAGKYGQPDITSQLLSERKDSKFLMPVHRLDMDTSGILLFAKSPAVFKMMQRQFAERKTAKQYAAILDGIPAKAAGKICLPICPDIENRPLQKVDRMHGKESETIFKTIGKALGGRCARVIFIPLTGRTHQLRLHAAHPEGLGIPILGDRLYGHPATRLYLHASKIEFTHPVTGARVSIESSPEF